MTPNTPKVALLIETARSYGRGLLRGIAKYSRLHGPWQFHLTPGDFEQIIPKMRDWGGMGIIARVLNETMANAILQTGLPTVFLDFPMSMENRKDGKKRQFIDMSSDSENAARLAASHLLEKQLVHFAFAGYPFQTWSEKREQSFVAAIGEAGYSVHVYRTSLRAGQPLRWEKEEPFLMEWLKLLPKPIGVMACNDQRGREVLDACELAEIHVPEKLAVIGVDNDDILCELCTPPLTSVTLNTEKGGYVAAGVLDEMMKGNLPPMNSILVEPLGIVERRSTDIIAIEDGDVAVALQYIHSNAVCNLSIDNIVKEVTVSRRALEVKFRKILGKTILDEIQRVRLEHSKRLLHETEMSIPEIASDVGFNTPSYFIQVFSKDTGMTPAKYRRFLYKGWSD